MLTCLDIERRENFPGTGTRSCSIGRPFRSLKSTVYLTTKRGYELLGHVILIESLPDRGLSVKCLFLFVAIPILIFRDVSGNGVLTHSR